MWVNGECLTAPHTRWRSLTCATIWSYGNKRDGAGRCGTWEAVLGSSTVNGQTLSTRHIRGTNSIEKCLRCCRTDKLIYPQRDRFKVSWFGAGDREIRGLREVVRLEPRL